MVIKLIEALLLVVAGIYLVDMIVSAVAARIERHDRK